MKRIAIVAHGLSDGGAERVASILANKLSERGNKVLFVAVYNDEREYHLNEEVSYEYIRCKYKNKALKLIARSNEIRRKIKNFKADLAISFIQNEMLLTELGLNTPIIYSMRNDPNELMKDKLTRSLCNFLYKRAKKIVFQTPGARDCFCDRIKNNGVIIGNPLTGDFPVWDIDGHEKYIMTACRLNPQKNLKMLIAGFSQFCKSHPEYTLKIYGKGALLDELISYSEECGIKDKVSFPGHSSDIHNIMSKAAVFAMTSDFEGLSNSMLEALAIGVPTVCTDCEPGGAALYIKDRVNGMLIPKGDVVELSERLCELADDLAKCTDISNKARTIRDMLDVDIIVDKWESIM